MRPTRVLIVEDEADIAGLIKHALERGGDIQADIAPRGDLALKAITEELPDLLILDLNLPVINGFEVCRILRAKSDTKAVPIIMLTARVGQDDRISGLNLGADDYVTKPFNLAELVARVRAVLRRGTPAPEIESASVYQGSRVLVDFDAISVSADGQPVHLTRREFELLRCLLANRNRILSRDRLLERVWGYDSSVEARSVDVQIGRLRGKLRGAGDQIETILGFGYRFVDGADGADPVKADNRLPGGLEQ